MAPKGSKNNLKHGMRYTRIYNIWRSMRQRCKNPHHINYHNYGGKGVTVCDEWDNSFETFYSWAIKNGYTDTLTIDRIDSNGNYEPSNCRWASYKVQANNTKSNHLITYNGVTRTKAEWADITGINYGTICARLERGWTVEDTLNVKAYRGRNQFSCHIDNQMTIYDFLE